MYALNRATIIGNLGGDPEIRVTGSGGKVASFSVATSESWKDKGSGERREKTEWHRVVVFNEGLCGVIERNLKKGSKVFVAGQIETRKWQDKAGVDRYVTEIVLRAFGAELVLLDGRDGPGRPPPNDAAERAGAPSSYADMKGRSDAPASGRALSGASGGDNASARASSGAGGGTDLDDDIPF